MRRLILIVFVAFVFNRAGAQSLYDSVNYRHTQIAHTSLTILSAWSLASLTSGIIGKNNSTGEVREFHRRNILWGGINLGLSGLGLLRLQMESRKAYNPYETLKRVGGAQKIFLFNTGLDLAYVGLALYTRERAYRFTGEKKDKLRGTGNSLLLQGAFLTVFDGVLYYLHSKNARRLDVKLKNLSFIASPGGMGLALKL